MLAAAMRNDAKEMYVRLSRNETPCAKVGDILAERGQFDLLRDCIRAGCTVDAITCSRAALGGKWSMVQWLKNMGCELDDDVLRNAVYSGRWDIARWAIQNKCAVTPRTARLVGKLCGVKLISALFDSIGKNDHGTIESIESRNVLFSALVKRGKTDIRALEWLRVNGYDFRVSKNTSRWCLQWLKRQMAPVSWRRGAILACILLGDANSIIKRLSKDDLSCDGTEIYRFAAANRHEQLLARLLDLGYSLDGDALSESCIPRDRTWLAGQGLFVDPVCACSGCCSSAVPFEWLCPEHYPLAVDALLENTDISSDLCRLIVSMATSSNVAVHTGRDMAAACRRISTL